jgi:hypothetical protein
MKNIKIVKPLRGLSFFYQPIYKQFRNYKFKDISILEEYQYSFLEPLEVGSMTENWLKLKFSPEKIIIDSIYNPVSKTYSNNVSEYLTDTLQYYEVLYCGIEKTEYDTPEPYCIISDNSKKMVGKVIHDQNDFTQLYLRSIVEYLSSIEFDKIKITGETDENKRWIILIESLYVEFKDTIYNFNFTGETYNFNFNCFEKTILTEADNTLNYRIFFNFLTNYKLSWKGSLYNNEFKDYYFSIKQELNRIKYDC